MKRLKVPVVFADYEVKLTNKYPKVGKEQVLGFCDYASRKIEVFDHPSNPELCRATFWHEWLHAAFRELGRGTLAQDEMLVDGLANALMRVRLKYPKL